jgi:hypothetical protein
MIVEILVTIWKQINAAVVVRYTIIINRIAVTGSYIRVLIGHLVMERAMI